VSCSGSDFAEKPSHRGNRSQRVRAWRGWASCIQSAFDLQLVGVPRLHREGNPPARWNRILVCACCRVNCERSWTRGELLLWLLCLPLLSLTPILTLLGSWLTEARGPASGARTELPIKHVHGRHTGKQRPLWDSALPSLELLGSLDTLGFSAKRLKKTSHPEHSGGSWEMSPRIWKIVVPDSVSTPYFVTLSCLVLWYCR